MGGDRNGKDDLNTVPFVAVSDVNAVPVTDDDVGGSKCSEGNKSGDGGGKCSDKDGMFESLRGDEKGERDDSGEADNSEAEGVLDNKASFSESEYSFKLSILIINPVAAAAAAAAADVTRGGGWNGFAKSKG